MTFGAHDLVDDVWPASGPGFEGCPDRGSLSWGPGAHSERPLALPLPHPPGSPIAVEAGRRRRMG